MAVLGRSLPQPPQVLRVPLLVLAVQASGAVTGASTAAATVTAARTDTAAVTGASTAAISTVASAPPPAVNVDLAAAVTAAGVVSGLASIPAYRINRAPFGRT